MVTDPRPARPQSPTGAASASGNAPGRRVAILDLGPAEQEALVGKLLKESGQPRYRLRQTLDWIHRRGPEDFDAMSDLPKGLRRLLAERLVLHPLHLRERLESRDTTQKFLWQLEGGDAIESVIIPDEARITFCISSQAGCAVKCPFCATGQGGFRGHLRPSEIIDQVLQMTSMGGCSPTNIVFMGMGEPLLNLDAVCQAIDYLTDPRGLDMGDRRITVSTVGIPVAIRELSARFPQVKIALSLHAARDELRDELVPLNRKHPLDQVLKALKEVSSQTGRLVTFEYVVLPGVNDSQRDVDDIVRRLQGIRSRINLIGYNPTPGAPYRRPSVRELVRFKEQLARRFPGPVTLRRSRGDDIDGACGQLRASFGERSPPRPGDEPSSR